MARVVITPASLDYDPTEVAIPWAVLRRAGHEVVIATANGERPEPDLFMLRGEGLDPWSWIPGLSKLRVVGRILGADANARRAHAELEDDPAFVRPLRIAELDAGSIDALVLPGGHRARGIRAYLEDATLHALVAAMFDAGKPVGAICHGVVVAARATSPRTGRSVLHGKKTTSLTWAQERLATRIACVTRFWDGAYYRTYEEEPGEPAGHRSVQAEVTRALADPTDYRDVPRDDPHHGRKTSGRVRDTPEDATPAFVVRDGSYVSARWRVMRTRSRGRSTRCSASGSRGEGRPSSARKRSDGPLPLAVDADGRDLEGPDEGASLPRVAHGLGALVRLIGRGGVRVGTSAPRGHPPRQGRTV